MQNWIEYKTYCDFSIEYQMNVDHPKGNWVGFHFSDMGTILRAQSPEELEKLIDQHNINRFLGLESNGCNF